MKRLEISQYIDHTNLKANAIAVDIDQLCQIAKDLGVKMVAINPFWTNYCRNYMDKFQSDVHVGAAISFPLGQDTLEVKMYQTKDAIKNGADEIDYVVNLSEVKDHLWEKVVEEMRAIVDVCRENEVISKVIFEICYLDDEEIIHLCEIANIIKPDFIKTSTGMGKSGATIEAVKLMRKHAHNDIQIKAAGGIRTLKEVEAYIEAGATRIGTSSTVNILNEITD